MATSSNWKGPIIAIAVVATLALGVLAASLVKLAGNFESTPAPTTVTVTTAAPAAVAPTTTATPTVPRATTPAVKPPTVVAPGAVTKTPGRIGGGTPPARTSPGNGATGTKKPSRANRAEKEAKVRAENEERRHKLGK
jgi:hypothetical protein